MQKYVKHLIVVLSLLMVILCSGVLTGCGNGTNTDDTKSTETTENTQGAVDQTSDVALNNTEDPSIKATCAKKGATTKVQDAKAIEKEIFNLVNKERAKVGKPAFKWNDTLYKATVIRAKEITTKFSHTRPNNSSCFTAITQAGLSYKSAAENIALGQTSAAQVMKAWMGSSGHKANIMSGNKTFACAAIASPSGRGYAFVQLFCTPK